MHIATSSQGIKLTTSHDFALSLQTVNMLRPQEIPIELQKIAMTQRFQADCGFQTIATLTSLLQPASDLETYTVAQATEMRYIRAFFLPGRTCPPLHLGGAQIDPLKIELRALLEQHGVPDAQQDQRCETSLERLGRAAVQQALRARRPWMDLKAKANACLPKLQLVHPSELEAVVQSKKESRVGTKAQKVKIPSPPITMKPQDVEIPKGVFKQMPDTPIGQLAFEQLGRDQTGVVVATPQQAVHYIGQKPISTGGLALLVMDHQNPLVQNKGQLVKFPAKCASTDEPVIATAMMVQLGQQQVCRDQPSATIALEQVEHIVLRVLAVADEYGANWHAFWSSISLKPLRLFSLPSKIESISSKCLIDSTSQANSKGPAKMRLPFHRLLSGQRYDLAVHLRRASDQRSIC